MSFDPVPEIAGPPPTCKQRPGGVGAPLGCVDDSIQAVRCGFGGRLQRVNHGSVAHRGATKIPDTIDTGGKGVRPGRT